MKPEVIVFGVWALYSLVGGFGVYYILRHYPTNQTVNFVFAMSLVVVTCLMYPLCGALGSWLSQRRTR